MTVRKPPTHNAYCVVRQGRRAAGHWMEVGSASVADNGIDLKVYLPLIPVTGFDGHILLRPIDAVHEPFPSDPEEEEEDAVEMP
ncbi:hypothetical protein HNQ77_004831 [Silvibacterium bohemicum]|uniref:Uncharacterized protein n=1 Tax=Silvibacterium bohemicum TaxID=1577686 RepID=A0A841K0B9_9BACT|nr:hypothetical protein [Silvibacterium bohemicum]MBB6146850.1 hypothetical protein [Silvibacterium bohemicum]